MAVRKPLYLTGSNQFQEMSTAMVDEIVDQMIYQYSTDPTVELSLSSGTEVATINDTRLQASAVSSDVTDLPSDAETDPITTKTITYTLYHDTETGLSAETDTGKTWPVYMTATNQIQAMSLQDVKDTFIYPAIDLLTSASTTTQQGGTYHVNTTVSGAVGTIFTDTRADASAYSASDGSDSDSDPTLFFTEDKTYSSGGGSGTNTFVVNNVTNLLVGHSIAGTGLTAQPGRAIIGAIDVGTNTITVVNANAWNVTNQSYDALNFSSQASGTYRFKGEVIDQPAAAINTYYLHLIAGSDTSYTDPLYITGGNNLQTYASATFKTLLKDWVRKVASDEVGYRISYNLTESGSPGSGNVRGTSMIDTVLNGSGDFQQKQHSGDDYRAQEFPNGTQTTASTYSLRINKS